MPGTSLDTLQYGAFELKTLTETVMKITNTQHSVISSAVEFVYYMQRGMRHWEEGDEGRAGLSLHLCLEGWVHVADRLRMAYRVALT